MGLECSYFFLFSYLLMFRYLFSLLLYVVVRVIQTVPILLGNVLYLT